MGQPGFLASKKVSSYHDILLQEFSIVPQKQRMSEPVCSLCRGLANGDTTNTNWILGTTP